TIPNTGITLPFVSYGGTSLVFLLLEMGLVLSVSSLVK
ncbi:MAG: FtsW/RodA/SpoVE family cell cycle protein, partial [[Clostridium] scindens]